MNQLKSFLEQRKQADNLPYQRNLSVIDYVERENFSPKAQNSLSPYFSCLSCPS